MIWTSVFPYTPSCQWTSVSYLMLKFNNRNEENRDRRIKVDFTRMLNIMDLLIILVPEKYLNSLFKDMSELIRSLNLLLVLFMALISIGLFS